MGLEEFCLFLQYQMSSMESSWVVRERDGLQVMLLLFVSCL